MKCKKFPLSSFKSCLVRFVACRWFPLSFHVKFFFFNNEEVIEFDKIRWILTSFSRTLGLSLPENPRPVLVKLKIGPGRDRESLTHQETEPLLKAIIWRLVALEE